MLQQLYGGQKSMLTIHVAKLDTDVTRYGNKAQSRAITVTSYVLVKNIVIKPTIMDKQRGNVAQHVKLQIKPIGVSLWSGIAHLYNFRHGKTTISIIYVKWKNTKNTGFWM